MLFYEAQSGLLIYHKHLTFLINEEIIKKNFNK